jgi:hypothetical protein
MRAVVIATRSFQLADVDRAWQRQQRAWRPGCPWDPRPTTRTPPTPAALTRAMGSRFVPYYAALKRAEIARFEQTVTDWEQREYFDLY